MLAFPEHRVRLGDEEVKLRYAEVFPEASDSLYWASLWPASVALAHQLLEGPDLEGKQVLELGCGSGLAGIAAGLRGGQVTVTDLMPAALELAEQNWRCNGLGPTQLEEFDWCDPVPLGNFDLILGADILFQPLHFSRLAQSLGDLLGEGGTLLLADPGRPAANDFFARMLRAGYQVESQSRWVELHSQTFRVAVSELK